MINKTKEIDDVNLELFGDSLDSSILEKQINGIFNVNIPLTFKYNGSWNVSYECAVCNEKCSFGLFLDKEISIYPKLTYNQTQYLCSKFYKIEILQEIAALFKNIKLITNELGSFIIFENNFDPAFPISSSIQPIYYSCQACKVEYLSLFKNEFPIPAENGYPQGLIGSIFVDEIIQIEVRGEQKFVDLLEQFKSN